MSYISYFYNYPFTYGARRIYAPASERARKDFLSPRLIKQITFDTPFYEGQKKIYAEYDSELAKANYVRIVGNTEERFYYISNAAIIAPQAQETRTIEFNLIEDVWQTHFFNFSTNDTPAGGIRNAIVLQGTIPEVLPVANVLDFMQFNDLKKFAVSGSAIDTTPLFLPTEKWCAVVMCAYANGDERMFYQEYNSYAAAQNSDLYKLARTKPKDTSATGQMLEFVNALVMRGYCVPSRLFRVALLLGESDYIYSIDDGAGGFKDDPAYICYAPASPQGLIVGLEGEHVKIALPANAREANGYYYLSKKAIMTKEKEVPFSWLSLPDDEKLTRYAEFAITYPPAGASEELTIYMFVEGEKINITSAFEVGIRQNPASLQRLYNGDVNNVLSAVAAGVSGIGGAIGGIASGNYFGAAQSVISGTKYFTDVKAALATPELTRRGANNSNALWGFKGVAVIDYGEPDNAPSLAAKIKREGFALRTPTYVDTINTTAGTCVRVQEAEITGVDTEAAEAILNDLKRGVYFNSGTT